MDHPSFARTAAGHLVCLVAVLFLLLARPAACVAHPANLPSADMAVRADGTFRLTIRVDILAFALNDSVFRITDGPMLALLDGPPEPLERALADAKERFAGDFRIRASQGEAHVDSIELPTAARLREIGSSGRVRLPIMADITATGRLPAGTGTIAVRFPEVLGSIVLVVERPDEEPAGQPVSPGEYSEPFDVTVTAAEPATVPTAAESTPTATQPLVKHQGRWFGSFPGFVRLGFTHILPEGIDHILFVLGLFLLNTHLRPLLLQVTAFTVAHSLTLALSLYGVFSLPPSVVEPLIAASIVFVAVENIFTSKLNPWRPVVVFGFGLVHGLGFAEAIRELDLPRQDFLGALVGFNCGVELGQLAVVAIAFAAVGWFQKAWWYRRGIVIPVSVLIAVQAAWWTVERMTG